MLAYRSWLGCLALCEFGCQAQIDFTGLDAGVVTGGSPSGGGASTLGNSQTTGSVITTTGLFPSGATTAFATTVGGPNGGIYGVGGAPSDGGGDSTLSGGTSNVTAEPCDANVDACELPVTLVSNAIAPPARSRWMTPTSTGPTARLAS